ncbi:ECF transporter S component [Ornithinibacter aureus]|uniref:ECF transporter S component n=1 Tax=Ornithinibacter aureus TaxID=622664 RepID=A0ABP8KA02_9MICO|nr:ECF transporter S component [Ornithinibacter aureus]KAF0834198.1 energy-coupling factor transport system substrate-specific component [Ornithinibacter aureus]HNV42823.1 ECF transporter S component [Ornithinibacter sp.]HPV91043.1 ECF transporter S component [Ornithinibacter sp.]
MATQIEPTTQEPRSTTGRSLTATRPLMGWRTVDILTIAFLGAALGVAFWGWGVFYNGPVTALKIGYAPLMGLFVGPWFLAGVVGGLVVRRPGAALFCEVVAALVSMLPGTEWGATVLISGVLQGLGAELVFAIFGYKAFSVAVAALAGALSAPLQWGFEVMSLPAGGGGWYAEWVLRDKVVYLGAMMLSGAVIAGVLGSLLVRALARAGALSAFPPGQEHRESHAV